jgi:hypothetical protein
MYNPFKPLKETRYNTVDIKKLYNVFPSSLRRQQLSSNELVELLRSQISDRDFTIDELNQIIARLRALLSEADFSTLLDSTFGDLNSLFGGLTDNIVANARKTELQTQGYEEVGSTNLWVKLEGDPFSGDGSPYIDGARFYYDQYTDDKATIRTPIIIRFLNDSDKEIEFQLFENWLESNQAAEFEKYKQPIRTFKFSEIPASAFVDVNTRILKISSKQELSSGVSEAPINLLSGTFGIGRVKGKETRHRGDFEIRNLTDGVTKKYKMALRRDYND